MKKDKKHKKRGKEFKFEEQPEIKALEKKEPEIERIEEEEPRKITANELEEAFSFAVLNDNNNYNIIDKDNEKKSENQSFNDDQEINNQEINNEGNELFEIVNETPKNYKKTLCHKCHKNIPKIEVNLTGSQANIKTECNSCNYTDTLELNEYIKKLEKLNSEALFLCQKADETHKNKEATTIIDGKSYFCDACASELRKFYSPNHIQRIDEQKIKCEFHSKKFINYCEDCKINLCDACKITDHKTLNHNIIDLEKEKRKINLKEFKHKLASFENCIKNDLFEIKDNIINSLSFLIENIEKYYQSYIKRKETLIKLGRMIQENMEYNSQNLNYNLIKNIQNFSEINFKIPENILKLKDDKIDNVYKDYELLLLYLQEEKTNTLFTDSDIIYFEAEANLIKNEIETKLKKKILNAKKIYQASTDGDDAETFHEKCDNIYNTVVLIKNDANRIGGFTTQYWNYNGNFKADGNAFLFSLDKNKVYPVKNISHAINTYSNSYGPAFGDGCDLFVSTGCLSNNNSYVKQSDYEYFGDTLALNASKDSVNMTLVDYEVYRLYLED